MNFLKIHIKIICRQKRTENYRLLVVRLIQMKINDLLLNHINYNMFLLKETNISIRTAQKHCSNKNMRNITAIF